MPEVIVTETGCRGCKLCVDNCPVQVFERGTDLKGRPVSKAVHSDDCMGCFTCYYQCPSQCIKIDGVEKQRPFYRVDENVGFVRHFLEVEQVAEYLTEADWGQAYQDVSMTLVGLAKAIESIYGFGIEALAYHSGTLAAPHFPEIYEAEALEDKLYRLQRRLRHSFDFDFQINGDNLDFRFAPCGLYQVVKEEAGEEVGESVLCRLFHDYWASLIGVYSGIEYRYNLRESGTYCTVLLFP
jgi:NAD-dependent dihydropyrimidine dehydrogenase PreA subunit